MILGALRDIFLMFFGLAVGFVVLFLVFCLLTEIVNEVNIVRQYRRELKEKAKIRRK